MEWAGVTAFCYFGRDGHTSSPLHTHITCLKRLSESRKSRPVLQEVARQKLRWFHSLPHSPRWAKQGRPRGGGQLQSRVQTIMQSMVIGQVRLGSRFLGQVQRHPGRAMVTRQSQIQARKPVQASASTENDSIAIPSQAKLVSVKSKAKLKSPNSSDGGWWPPAELKGISGPYLRWVERWGWSGPLKTVRVLRALMERISKRNCRTHLCIYNVYMYVSVCTVCICHHVNILFLKPSLFISKHVAYDFRSSRAWNRP